MSRVKIVLQARLSSGRLPGKMLLPVGGLPLVVLCAKRAERTKFPLIVATSCEASDDVLCYTLEEYGIPFVRGSLDDVLNRFLLATTGMADDDLVIRLTGDNPVVDAEFIHSVLDYHRSTGGRYTRSLSPLDRLPYGVSAEVIEVGLLRELDGMGISPEDREHVTSYPTRQGDYGLYPSPEERDLSHLRVTVDTFDDYLAAARHFRDAKPDSVAVSWRELVKAYEGGEGVAHHMTPYKMVGLKPQSRLALGTAQLGLDYGISNKSGKPDKCVARNILRTAIAHGVNLIDTAAAYGDSEQVIGAALNSSEKLGVDITTKLGVLEEIDDHSNEAHIRNAVEASIYGSCHHLGIDKLPCLLLHRWQHYSLAAGKVWQVLAELKAKGIIGKLGVSVQSPEEGMEALEAEGVEFIQLPFNVLDWRWQESGFVDKVLQHKNIHIQARSALLQGVLLLPPERWPVIDSKQAGFIANQIDELVKDLGRESIQDLCYAYVRAMEWVDSIVVGVETESQLLENLKLFRGPEVKDVRGIQERIGRVDCRLLNPAEWSKA